MLELLYEKLQTPIEQEGYILWGIEIESRPSKREALIRIYIDHEEGIGLTDCETVSRLLSSILDVEDIIQNHYVLEVSSPGADRLIFNLAQAKALIHQIFKVRLLHPVAQYQRGFKAQLIAVNEDTQTLTFSNVETEDQVEVNFDSISKIRIIPQW